MEESPNSSRWGDGIVTREREDTGLRRSFKSIELKSTRRILAAAVAVAVATLGGVAATASPAQAAVWSCPASIGCFYADYNGGGSILTVGPGQGCFNVPFGWNDRVSSVRNIAGHGYLLRWWVDANCSGRSWSTGPGGQGNMAGGSGTVYPFPNNAVSSFAVYPPGSW